MNRRDFIAGASTAIVDTAIFGQAVAQSDPLTELMRQLETNPALVEDGWLYRTRELTLGVGTGRASARQISARSSDMIIQFEVVSRRRYEQVYDRPIWPKGQSGVTIGIGYDLRFANRAILQRDWADLVDQTTLAKLEPVLRLGGTRAREALPQVRDVRVPWAPAESQFRSFLPYAIAQTEDLFANSRELSDDSMGALVSLVYNRGPSVSRDADSRREMRRIRELMQAREFAGIPAQIRLMKRLWEAKPDARGLLIRRDAEALLFEQGRA